MGQSKRLGIWATAVAAGLLLAACEQSDSHPSGEGRSQSADLTGLHPGAPAISQLRAAVERRLAVGPTSSTGIRCGRPRVLRDPGFHVDIAKPDAVCRASYGSRPPDIFLGLGDHVVKIPANRSPVGVLRSVEGVASGG